MSLVDDIVVKLNMMMKAEALSTRGPADLDLNLWQIYLSTRPDQEVNQYAALTLVILEDDSLDQYQKDLTLVDCVLGPLQQLMRSSFSNGDWEGDGKGIGNRDA